VTPGEALHIQHELRSNIKIQPLKKTPRWVAGADISYERYSDIANAGFVVLDVKTCQIVARSSAVGRMTFPYIPGFLSFREIPILIEAWKNLKIEPDVVIYDGQGIAHPRRLGIASHMGLVTGHPSIGCAKSLLIGKFRDLGELAGSTARLIHEGEVIGSVLRTKDHVHPVYLSPGHLIDVKSSVQICLEMTRGYRIPEPTRLAHLHVNDLRRQTKSTQLDLIAS